MLFLFLFRKKWEMSVFEGEWVQGATAGGCRNYLESKFFFLKSFEKLCIIEKVLISAFWQNPQYIVTLENPDEHDNDGLCTIIVALMQKNRRCRRADCLTIGFAIYRVTERDIVHKPLGMNFFKYNASVARSPAFINLREVCFVSK